jgi:hypothetical protein
MRRTHGRAACIPCWVAPAVIVALALAAVACDGSDPTGSDADADDGSGVEDPAGGVDDADEEGEAAEDADVEDEAVDETPPSGPVGTVLVDGEPLQITEVTRCAPFTEASDELDLTGTGDITVFVYIGEFSGQSFQEVAVQGEAAGGALGLLAIEESGEWRNDADRSPLEGPPLQWDDGRLTATDIVLADLDGAASRTIGLDLPVPDEVGPGC